MRKYIFLLTFTLPLVVKAQDQKSLFEASLSKLEVMLADNRKYSFRDAVFSVENAYLNGGLDTVSMNGKIKSLTSLCNAVMENRVLNYEGQDRKNIDKWAAVYQVMCDSIPLVIDGKQVSHMPFRYDFNDVFGNGEFHSIFVSKLLVTRKGNCHSLPYLYKILCEELGTTASLALAPNHIYIKHQSKNNGWYNTELTSGIFPNDAWLMASGFIHVDAVRNGVYMKALNDQESIAVVLIDLAEAYNKTFPNNDGTFPLRCAEDALKVFPNLTSALILKAEIHKARVKTQTDFKELEKEYLHIHTLGYRFMPEEMYLDWLVSLKTERDKYENKKLSNFNKK